MASDFLTASEIARQMDMTPRAVHKWSVNSCFHFPPPEVKARVFHWQREALDRWAQSVSESRLKGFRQLVRMSTIAKLVSFDKNYIYRLVRQGRFPKPVIRFGNYVAWDAADVIAWQEKRIDETLRREEELERERGRGRR